MGPIQYILILSIISLVAKAESGADGSSGDGCGLLAAKLKAAEGLYSNCEAKARQISTERDAVKERNTELQSQLTTAHASLEDLKQQHDSCKHLQESCERARAEDKVNEENCAAVQSERDGLLESRRELAATLEQVQSKVAQLEAERKDLQYRLGSVSQVKDSLERSEDERGKLEGEKVELESKVQSQSSEMKTLNEKISALRAESKKASEESERLRTSLKQTQELLTKSRDAHSEVLQKVESERRPEYLCSVAQLTDTVRGLWSLLRAVSTYVAGTAYDAVIHAIPDSSKETAMTLWRDNSGKVVEMWQSKMQPTLDQTHRSLSSNSLLLKSRGLYDEHLAPSVGYWAEEGKTAAFQAAAVSSSYISEYLEMANNKVDQVFIYPLTVNYPEIKPLVPSHWADRLCLFGLAAITLWQLLKRIGLITRVLLFAVKLAVPCCWCQLCASRSNSSKGLKGAKAKRARKSFYPTSTDIPTKPAATTTATKISREPTKEVKKTTKSQK